MRRLILSALVPCLALLTAFAVWPHESGARFSAAPVEASGEACSPARPHASGTTVETVSTISGPRSYRLHVPASYTGSAPVPIVLSFHGAHSNAIEEEVYSGHSTQSDSMGFIVAYPDGKVSNIPFTHFNAWQFPPPEQDDVAFTNAILNTLEAQLCIDQSRVYSAGISNGAMMSIRLACSLSSRIAAIAPVAGAYYPPDALNINPLETCPDTRSIPLIAFHGTADDTVPFNGGGTAPTYRLPIDNNTPAEDVLSDWAAHDACTGSRQESQFTPEVRFIQYDTCAGGALVQLYAVDGGGHTWPGSFDVPSLGYTTHQISATDLMWAFFTNYTLPDADIDLIPDTADNCPAAANFSQQNTDGNFFDNSPPYVTAVDDKTNVNSDATGDACDADADNDGLPDTIETAGPPCASATAATDPLKLDTDGDRITDGAECALGSDPADVLSKPVIPSVADDPDHDLLSTAFEGTIGTDPLLSDTDGDGVSDGVEYRGHGSNPLVVDTDADGVRDRCEIASLNADTIVNSGDQALLATEIMRAVPPASKLADFDLNKDTVLNSGDQALLATAIGPGKCP